MRLFKVRSICDHVRPDRQCSLFSATFKRRIERLARDVLSDPVKIVQVFKIIYQINKNIKYLFIYYFLYSGFGWRGIGGRDSGIFYLFGKVN